MTWNYRNVQAFPYDDEYAYGRGMDELDDCETVEDWGCGTGWAKRYRDGPYVGVDLAPGFADIVADLRTYRSEVDGIFMRGVLEHNDEWEPILDNALASARKRLVLVLFTPPGPERVLIEKMRDVIPTYSWVPADTEERFGDRPFRFEDWHTETQFHFERMYVVECGRA